VFSMQGIGQVLVPIVGLICLNLFGTPGQEDAKGEMMKTSSWRLLLGIGALPGILLAPFRTASPSPTTENSTKPAQISLWKAVSTPKYLKKLVGTAGGWFIFDITFYGNTLFAPTVLHAIFHTEGATPVNGPDLEHNLCYQLLILALIGLPGYYVSVFLMDKLGRKNIQLQGFFMMAVLYAVLALWLDQLPPAVLLIVYGLTYFFSNFGPNSTTFILPSETFPFEVRSTLNGFSAAMGKAGAVLGSAAFKPIADSAGNGAAMALCAFCSVAGLILTALFVEDRRGRGMAGNSIIAADEKLQNMDP